MPRTTKTQPKSEPIAESPAHSFSSHEVPQAFEGTVDEMAWKVISQMFPIWVKGRVAFLLQSNDPAHVEQRKEIFTMLQGAIFAQALAGAGLNESSNVLPPRGG